MFHPIAQTTLERMQALELIDARDRQDGTPGTKRLRQITPDTGRFLALMAANAPEGACLEIGTIAWYSTLWIALACQMSGRTLTTFEVLPEKARLACETFQITQLEGIVKLVEGDARDYISQTLISPSAFWTPRRKCMVSVTKK